MTDDEKLTVPKVAALYNIKPATFRVYVHRKQAPEADGYFDGRTPYWLRSTLEAWRPITQTNESAPAAGKSDGGKPISKDRP